MHFSIPRQRLISELFFLIEKLIFGVFSCLLIFWGLFDSSFLIHGFTLLKIGIVINIILMFKSRKIKPVALMFFFFVTYMLNLIPYYTVGFDVSGGFSRFDIPEYYLRTLYHHVLFLSVIALFFPRIKEQFFFKDYFFSKTNDFYFWFTFAFMVFIYLFGARGATIFSSGGYTQGEITNFGGTSLFEYFIVLVPLVLKFSGKRSIYKVLASTLIILFMLKGLLFGYRSQILQISLCLFALYDNPKVKYWHLFLLGSIPLYFLILWGAIRINPFILFTSELKNVLLYPIRNFGFEMLANQNNIFYASVRIYGMVHEGIISSSERVLATVSTVFAIITPYSFLPDIANLALFKQKEYGALGGGLISTYWYVFGGLPGIIFIGCYIAFIIKKLTQSPGQYFLIYMVMVLSTYPRWLGYSQISLFKICSYAVLYYICLQILKSVLKQKRKI